MGRRISLRYKNEFSCFSFLFSNDISVVYFICNYIQQVAGIIHQISMELQVVRLNYSPPRSIANSTIRERAEIKGKKHGVSFNCDRNTGRVRVSGERTVARKIYRAVRCKSQAQSARPNQQTRNPRYFSAGRSTGS